MAWSPGPSRYPEVESDYELFETLGSGIVIIIDPPDIFFSSSV